MKPRRGRRSLSEKPQRVEPRIAIHDREAEKQEHLRQRNQNDTGTFRGRGACDNRIRVPARQCKGIVRSPATITVPTRGAHVEAVVPGKYAPEF